MSHMPEFLATAKTVGEAYAAARVAYASHDVYFGHGFVDAEHELRYLFEHALASGLPQDLHDTISHIAETSFLNSNAAPLSAASTQTLSPAQRRAVEQKLFARLVERKPLPYVVHEAWQGEYAFYVDERVLIPRSYIAELLFDELAPWIPDPDAALTVLDLCCGSACLGIIASQVFPDVPTLTLSDISTDALDVARINVNRYFIDQIAPTVKLVQSDVFDGLRNQRFDLIVSNPPYVTTASMRALPAEYRHEPALALAAGNDGLDVVHRILREAKHHLSPEGVLVVEVGNNQDLVMSAYADAPLTWIDTPNSEGAVFIATFDDLDCWQ